MAHNHDTLGSTPRPATIPIPLIPGARLDLQGTCNQCGLCCTVETPAGRVVCEHLEAYTIGGHVKPLGHPLASRCRVYAQRRSGMQIAMKDGQGTVRLIGRCFKNTWQEDHAIAALGIGQGCSLSLPLSEGHLTHFEPENRR